MIFAAPVLLNRLSSVCCLARPSAYSAVVCRCVHDLVWAETFSFPEALTNSTNVISVSVLGVGDAEEIVAPHHPGPPKPSTPDSAVTHGGIIVSSTASPELERDLCHVPERGRGARSRDSEPHSDPASPEACSKTQVHSANGWAGGERRVCFHTPRQSINSLSTDRAVADDTATQAKDQSVGAALRAATQPWRAAISEGERAIALSTITLPSEDKYDGPHHTSSTVSDALMDPG